MCYVVSILHISKYFGQMRFDWSKVESHMTHPNAAIWLKLNNKQHTFINKFENHQPAPHPPNKPTWQSVLKHTSKNKFENPSPQKWFNNVCFTKWVPLN